MSYSDFPMGSVWRKWDLHVHSPLSILNNQFRSRDGEDVWESYISKLEETDMAVLGVTDYFSIDGYKKVLEFKNDGRLANIDLVLPNIELRLNEPADNRRINFHVIFSDKVCADDIEDHFLHELRFPKSGNPQSTDDMDKLKRDNLERLGRRIRSENEGEYNSLNDLQAGATVATVSHKDISDLLQDERFRDKYVLVLDAANLPPWHGQMHNIRRVLTQKADFVFTSNPENIRWYLGRKGYNDPEDFKREFETLKPCIHGSDAHELFFVGHPCANRGKEGHNCKLATEDCELRYCWIKADPTFEGLKQVMYEPEDRVFIGGKDPTRSRYNHTLARIKLSETEINSELTLEATNIPLHRGLVAITGGRGTGKTAFVDLIANCYADPVDKQTHDSFVVRIASDSPLLDTTIEFTGADLFTKTVGQKEQVIKQANLAYVSQGQLDDYIDDDNELSKRIRELLFGAATEVLDYEFQSLADKIKKIEHQIAAYSSQIIDLENQTSDNVSAELENRKNRIETELQDLRRQLGEIEESAPDKQEIEEAQDAQADLSSLRDKQKNLSKLKEQVANAGACLDVDIPRFNEAIESINELLESLHFDGSGFSRIDYVQKGKLDDLTVFVEDSIRETLAEIDTKQEELNKRNERVALHTTLLDKRSETENKLTNAIQQSQNLVQLREQLQTTINSRAGSYRQLLGTVAEIRTKYLEIIARFKDPISTSTESKRLPDRAVLKDLEFLAEIHFDRDAFLEEAKDLFDGRSIVICSEFSETLERYDRFADEAAENCIASLAESIETHVHPSNKELRDKIKPNKSINLDDFFKVFYKNYFRVSSTVRYKQIPLERLSLGQKATVLFKIYLAHGDYPVVIDSHDDYLDNEFIMDELGPAIREAKERRQVILVSNNANIVVNADAEQVIVANYDNGTISYSSGSLEDPLIRAKLLEVLEGGEAAFKKRQDKYRMR